MSSVSPTVKHVKNSADRPLILAPAGNRSAFLAALAAGADAVYCGLKLFSARMEAKNFSIDELARLTALAHKKKVQVYVALNSLVKTDELDAAAQVVGDLADKVRPDGLILQDPAFMELARQIGFSGQLHLSTLANVTFPMALGWIKAHFKVDRVVMPRELNVDEIKTMAADCPNDMDLETFIHGALCYGVSGRCYWSSWLGGKSGLRGRCVQPCRRLYRHQKELQRFFSCQDLSIDVLCKVLKEIKAISVWKIEGRKKGPHYVYYTVQAYRLLRDHHHEPACKRDALALLEHSLGRRGTHYNFLPQRPQNPVDPESQTGSGLLLGRVQGSSRNAVLLPRIALLPGDVLRIGYEDQDHHSLQRINRFVPKKGRLSLKITSQGGDLNGAPVFLTDRREKALEEMIASQEAELEAIDLPAVSASKKRVVQLPSRKFHSKAKVIDMDLHRRPVFPKGHGNVGVWLSEAALKLCGKSTGRHMRICWWLPPVIWPSHQAVVMENLKQAISLGSRFFVLNAPWQMAFFSNHKGFDLWAGPFCNAANPLTLNVLKKVGFSGVIVSAELGRTDYELLARSTPLPLGMILSGHFPLCISRVAADNISLSDPFQSPKGEIAWIQPYESDYWVYPNWRLDLTEKKSLLESLGYRLFVNIHESVPATVTLKNRPGLWNWDVGLG